LRHGKTVFWQFNHGGELDVPYFHKLGLMDGVAMKPARCGGLTWSPWPE
jgi:hypothetical protein